MRRKIFLAFTTVASFGYAVFCFLGIVVFNKAPFSIECLGVKIKPKQEFLLSNSRKAARNKFVLEYSNGKGLMPETLGKILYNNGNVSAQLIEKIIHIDSTQTNNPFWAIARSHSGKYFLPNSLISEGDLVGGVKFSSVFGDKLTNVFLRLINFNNEKFISTNSEGICTKYSIKSDSINVFGLCLNSSTPSNLERVFHFTKLTNQVANYSIEVFPKNFNKFDLSVKRNGELVSGGSFTKTVFTVGDILFSIQPKFHLITIILYLFTLLTVVIFQVFFFKVLFQIGSPLISSTVSLQVHFNNLFFLGAPIFFLSLTVSEGRWFYLFSIIAINLSYFLPRTLLHKLSFRVGRLGTVLLVSLLLCLPVLMYLKHHRETLFDIPILHFQKLLTLVLIYFSQTKVMKSFIINYWLKLLVFVGYSLVLSFITKDIGSFIYTSLALFFIEIVKANISKSRFVTLVLLLIAGIFIVFKWIPNSFSDKKLYRIVSPYTSPSSPNLSASPEADKETFSNLHLIQKALINQEVGKMNSIVVPANMRSTSFSDYAFFWSIVYGKILFLLLFFIVYFYLISDLILLLYASLRPMRINKEFAFVLPLNRESAFISFLISFAIISFSYPVFSNLLLLPLTGQSLPFISVSLFEGFYFILFLIPLNSIFTNPSYFTRQHTIKYKYGNAKRSRDFNMVIFCILIFSSLVLKIVKINSMPSYYQWDKYNSSVKNKFDTINLRGLSQNDLISKAAQEIRDENSLKIPNYKKQYLRNFASYYWAGKSYLQLHPENRRFENSVAKVRTRLNFDSLYFISKTLVSGPHSRFGNVYKFRQQVNGRSVLKFSNRYYSSIQSESSSIYADLTALINLFIEQHIKKIGISTNKASVIIVNNESGNIISNSFFPLETETIEAETPYFIGSVKKILIAYCALVIDPSYYYKRFNSISFSEFIQWSNNDYAAALLKDLMLFHEKEFQEILLKDFNMPFISNSVNAFFDRMPELSSYRNPLNNRNVLYRIAIGQEKPYSLSEVVSWYARIASGKRIVLNNESNTKQFENMSLQGALLDTLHNCFRRVINFGTAKIVGEAMKHNHIPLNNFFGKTGTAQKEKEAMNSSSTFVLCTKEYSIGISLNGTIPLNSRNLAAKNLLVTLIPVLKEFKIL